MGKNPSPAEHVVPGTGPNGDGSPGLIRVGVLVSLFYSAEAGGHVKAWERFAQAAARHETNIDLTVHYLGHRAETIPLNAHTRLQLHEPRWSTLRFAMLSEIPDHTDLASYHPGLAQALANRDVIHTTDAFFSFARTAERMARSRSVPLVNSVHTDTPSYTRVYTAKIIERLVGKGLIGRALLNGFKIHLRAERRMQRRLEEHQRRSAFVLVSQQNDVERLRALKGSDRVSLLRRGIDKALFHPGKRDRAWLQQRLGIHPDRTVVLFVGRLSPGKNVVLLADAVAHLIRQGVPLQLACAGQGPQRQAIVDRLGTHATLPGVLLSEELARLYASADVFAMPSEIEVFSNVVQEALASGLPIVISNGAGLGGMVTSGVNGLVVDKSQPEVWAETLRTVLGDPGQRQRMGQASRAFCESSLPSWDDVLLSDLVPIWRAASRLASETPA